MVEAIAAELDVIISLDTSTPAVMRGGARLGAGLINDVRALPRMVPWRLRPIPVCRFCLMHMLGRPGNHAAESLTIRMVVAEGLRLPCSSAVAACAEVGIPLSVSRARPGIRVRQDPGRTI